MLERFLQYHWPGNIRELENTIEYAVHITSNEKIKTIDLPDQFQMNFQDKYRGTLKEIIERTERQAILQALRKTNGNKREAAKLLGLGKSSFYDKVKKYRI